jgi:hypothetical protein
MRAERPAYIEEAIALLELDTYAEALVDVLGDSLKAKQ